MNRAFRFPSAAVEICRLAGMLSVVPVNMSGFRHSSVPPDKFISPLVAVNARYKNSVNIIIQTMRVGI
jgi:hypothetical protein